MKRLVQGAFVLAVLGGLAGCASMSKDETPPRLAIRSLIDGADRLMIRGDQMWFEHLAYQLPGRWSGSDYPTTINREIEWRPLWNGDFSESFVIPDKNSALPLGVAMSAETLKVTSNREKHQVSVAEYPNEHNDYTLVLSLDDRGPFGPHWFEIGLDWE